MYGPHKVIFPMSGCLIFDSPDLQSFCHLTLYNRCCLLSIVAILVRKPQGKKPREGSRRMYEDNIKFFFREIMCEGVSGLH
jgi:hypothetical protein